LNTNKAHITLNKAFQLNNKYYSVETINILAKHFIENGTQNEIQLGNFILNWIDDSDEIQLQTSGTTSKPTTICISKAAFINSAKATGIFFNLKAENSALCCLPFSYIAAKMMFIRAWVLGLKLDTLEPSSNPLEYTTQYYDFSAMVPLQVHKSYSKLNQIGTLLVGGAPVSMALANLLEGQQSAIFETFGMTETVSHIAAKNLSKGEKTFTVLPDISIAVNDNDCLVIKAPKLNSNILQTNDVVTLVSKHSFVWLGRHDNVVNSGGLKIHPEQLEYTLQGQIKNRFFIASIPDEILGQKVVLIIEGESQNIELDFSEINTKKRPKHTFFVKKFCETNSGKIQRQKTLETLNLNHS
jgi:O-succinylbenzoic acid--CoA ligase